MNLEYLLYLLRQPLAVCLVPIKGICSSVESNFHAVEKKGMEISSGQPQKLPLNTVSVLNFGIHSYIALRRDSA